MNSFFAMMSRMKYIDRWALMRNSRQENLSEHSLEVSMIAHALAVIGNTCLGKELDAQKAAVFGMYHDATEIITGDMPTPVKYYNSRIKVVIKISSIRLPGRCCPCFRNVCRMPILRYLKKRKKTPISGNW